MPSDLDRRYDAMLAKVTGPGGMVALTADDKGQAIPAGFPATVPSMKRWSRAPSG